MGNGKALENRRISEIPLVSNDVATFFHLEHGGDVINSDFIDATLRDMTIRNRSFIDELDRIAGQILEQRGIQAKLDFIRANAIGYALLSQQVNVDSLEAIYQS